MDLWVDGWVDELSQIAFVKDCGDDDVCEPELLVQWLAGVVGGLVVGARTGRSVRAQVNATLQLINAGETAYAVTLHVSFPRPALEFTAAAPDHLVCRSALCTQHHRHHQRHQRHRRNFICLIMQRHPHLHQ